MVAWGTKRCADRRCVAPIADRLFILRWIQSSRQAETQAHRAAKHSVEPGRV